MKFNAEATAAIFHAAPWCKRLPGVRWRPAFCQGCSTAGLINNSRHDFGSIIRFIEHNFGITEGALTFADSRARTDLTGFFPLNDSPRVVMMPGGQSAATFPPSL